MHLSFYTKVTIRKKKGGVNKAGGRLIVLIKGKMKK
jgi:hypothetical protein